MPTSTYLIQGRKERQALSFLASNMLWNFRRLSRYESDGNEIFLRHGNSEDWGSLSALWVEGSAIKGMLITWETN